MLVSVGICIAALTHKLKILTQLNSIGNNEEFTCNFPKMGLIVELN
jgi:hypothetical protein